MRWLAGAVSASRRSARAGFTLVELLVALTLGTIVVGAAINYLIRELRTLQSNDVRDVVTRTGRYVGISLRHDLQRAGIGIETTASFGTVDVWPGSFGDTLVILNVPYLPDPASPHTIVPPPGDENPLLPGSTCGPQCIEVLRTPDVPLDLEVAELTRLQVPGERRLALILGTSVTSDTSAELEFTDASTILRRPAGMEGLSLDRFATFVQELDATVYYLDEGDRLMRAVALNLDGSPRGQVLAYGVEEFDVRLVFADGDVLEVANPTDADDSNDYDDVVAVRVRITAKADRVHPLVNNGELLRKTFEWLVAPRNLRYEKDRL
ncbi:MAG: prepilin-type N-terminal cleavage/methylation domain-containing protein [Gemmatimonadales bacterium]